MFLLPACSQGMEVMETRHVSQKIQLSEVPFIMRALGYYPTEQEVLLILSSNVFLLFTGLFRKLQIDFHEIQKGFAFILDLGF